MQCYSYSPDPFSTHWNTCCTINTEVNDQVGYQEGAGYQTALLVPIPAESNISGPLIDSM
jgi:hypothetical protein